VTRGWPARFMPESLLVGNRLANFAAGGGEDQGTGLWYGILCRRAGRSRSQLILLIPILRNRARGELRRISLAIIGFLFTSAGCSVTSDLSANARNTYGCYLLHLFSRRGVWVTDPSRAFTFGKNFSAAIRCAAKLVRTRPGKARSEPWASP